MKRKIRISQVAALFAALILLIPFQNCAPMISNLNSAVPPKPLKQPLGQDAAPQQPMTSTPTTATAPLANQTPAIPTQASGSSTTMAPLLPAAVLATAGIETCNDYMTTLGAENFTDPMQVKFVQTFAPDRSPSGFEAIFEGKTASTEVRIEKGFKVETSGFSIKLKSLSGTEILAIPNSSYARYSYSQDVGNNGNISCSSLYPDRPYLNKKQLQFNLTTSAQLAGTVRAELYCFGRLVGAGTQDFRSFLYSNELLNLIICSTQTVPNQGINCHSEQTGAERIEWLINGNPSKYFGKYIGYFPGLDSAPNTTHTVQAIAVLPDGREVRSPIKTVRVLE